MALPIVHHPDYDAGFPVTHRFPMGKYRALMERLSRTGLATGSNLRTTAPAPARWLDLAHDPAYVGHVLSCSVPKPIEREIGFAVDERVSRRAQLATAGTLLAARLALEHGIACNTAGGSHHARRAQGAGFCTLNDVGVAASVLVNEGYDGQILVLDLDVHQGDGTADIFAGDDRVYTFSLHGERNYPVRKIASDLDIGLPDCTGDEAYLETLRAALAILDERVRPDLVFYNAGVDPHRDDRLGRMALTDDGLRKRDRIAIDHFRTRGAAVCGVIGGGYSSDIEALAGRHAILFDVAGEFA